jgi:two-component system, OmpR family, sensor histidine kinase KdpD
MGRGRLRVYLGAAPGVGKTFAMLGEGHRRAQRGTDVVIGYIETHGRQHTAEMAEGLETVPRRELRYRGATFEEMDADAILERCPQVALVDELAHTNVPGSRNEKRWQDVDELLAAGIDVITTVNIQHLESMNDVVTKITGVEQRETLPDEVVRGADQVELVDMAAEALRRRLAHGNVYAPEKVDAALGNYFRVGNLTALRELALLWVADKVDEALQSYRSLHDIDQTWEARERVVVALTGGPEGETLIRRAGRIAARASGGDLLAVYVAKSDGLTGANPAALANQRRLVESLGGTYHQVVGDDIPRALLSFARAENATQLVLGVSRRSRWESMLSGPGIGATTIRHSGDIDVHIVTHDRSRQGRMQLELRGTVGRRRQLQGLVLAALLPIMLTALLSIDPIHLHLNLVSDVLLFLVAVVTVALVGGLLPALLAALLGSLLMNYYFAPPVHTFTINERNNALALVVFLVVAAAVSSVVDLASRRTRQAAHLSAEAATLATLAGSVLRGERALPALLERVREAFGQSSVSLLRRIAPGPGADSWMCVEAVGEPGCRYPSEADTTVKATPDLVLALCGRPLAADDHRLIGAFAAQAAVALEHEELREEAAQVESVNEANRMRTALLAAVGHDLRTPLASAKAAVSGLLSRDITLDESDRYELLDAADSSLDRLAALVDNLLDMSRLQAGALDVLDSVTSVDEVVARALDALGGASRRVRVDVPVDLPDVHADPGLLERVLANLIENAVRHSPPGVPPLVTASALRDRVEIRIVDRGAGIPRESQELVFAPFQRLGDTDNQTGVGLGLALSRGLVEAMNGTLAPEETPGGGLTMVVSLPAFGPPDTAPHTAPDKDVQESLP